jgi:low temperature requirement protein LtrA
LIVIIAIGESLVAVGLGARDERLHGDVIVAALLGLLVAMSFWLAYFDFFTIRGRQLLDERSGEERIAIARDIYTYLHLPMVAGIVLFAFAVKSALKHLGDELGTIEALALSAAARPSTCSRTWRFASAWRAASEVVGS